MLMRGFSTVGDMAGNTFSLKRAIDEGRFPGPRIYPSGAGISQTGGHADYRPPNAVPRPYATDPDPTVRAGHGAIADGEAQVLIAAREQLRRGASQIKIMVGGGAASPTDPLDAVFALAKKKGYKKIAFGTDVIGDPALMARQNEEFTNRGKWFSNFEVIRQATSGVAELLAMRGPRDPYSAKLGVVEEGALADILLIGGNPLEDISVLTRPDENIMFIMKDGKIYKNALP